MKKRLLGIGLTVLGSFHIGLIAEANNPSAFNLSTSGGIVAPSFATAVFQNPAGLIYIPKTNVGVHGGWDNSFDSSVYRGSMGYGNGQFGVQGGVGWYPSAANATVGFFGIAVGIPSARTSLGVSGSTGISPSGGTTYNAGLLAALTNQIRLGFTAIDLESGVQEWGGGLEISLNPNFSLIVDATADKNFKTFQAQPGILVGSPLAALTLSYGTSPGSIEISNGFSVGGSLKVGKSASWQAYYNQLSKVYTAISFAL